MSGAGRSVECPYCEAKVGEPCTQPWSGKRTHYTHKTRLNDAASEQKDGQR